MWHFFATSHGKGAVDGIGGEVKRTVWKANLAGDPVSDAKSFVKVASKHCHKIGIHLIEATEISSRRSALENQWEGVTALSKTHMTHYVKCLSPYIVQSATYSDSLVLETVSLHPDFSISVHVNRPTQNSDRPPQPTPGCFVLVEYTTQRNSKKLFAAQVVQIEDSMMEVSFLRKVGLSSVTHSFPVYDDTCWIDTDQVIKVLPQPVLDTRGHYTFPYDIYMFV